MDKYEEFTKWAESRGVKRFGVAAHRFEGKGLGIVAERRIEAGSTILIIPTSAIRTAHTVPKSTVKALGKITVHGLLAADLSLDTSSLRAPWHAVLPTRSDFQSSLPFAGATITSPLSTDSQDLLTNQNRKYDLDWAATHHAFPSIPEETYRYYWCIVNTRTFFYVKPGTTRPKVTDDCMALVPFADLFNHDRQGCWVDYDQKGYKILADRAYDEGEELCISYGDHSDDFLRVEYGFVLGMNEH